MVVGSGRLVSLEMATENSIMIKNIDIHIAFHTASITTVLWKASLRWLLGTRVIFLLV